MAAEEFELATCGLRYLGGTPQFCILHKQLTILRPVVNAS